MEDDAPNSEHNTSMRGQLPHRGENEMIHGNDSDYPEPGENPEHSGEREENPEAQNQTQQPGDRQKRNQNWQKEDPLAS